MSHASLARGPPRNVLEMYVGGEIPNYSDLDRKSGQLTGDLCQQPLLITSDRTTVVRVHPI